MGSFLDGTHDRPMAKPIAYVHPLRKDGRHAVTLCFTARTIKKLLTPPQVADLLFKDYEIRNVR